jgi:hypothetical protein
VGDRKVEMAEKRFCAEQIINHLCEARILLSLDTSVLETALQIGMTEQTSVILRIFILTGRLVDILKEREDPWITDAGRLGSCPASIKISAAFVPTSFDLVLGYESCKPFHCIGFPLC